MLYTYSVYDHCAKQFWCLVDAESHLQACHEADEATDEPHYDYERVKGIPSVQPCIPLYSIAQIEDDVAGRLARLAHENPARANHIASRLPGVLFRRKVSYGHRRRDIPESTLEWPGAFRASHVMTMNQGWRY